jgi:hypothetical protein
MRILAAVVKKAGLTRTGPGFRHLSVIPGFFKGIQGLISVTLKTILDIFMYGVLRL